MILLLPSIISFSTVLSAAVLGKITGTNWYVGKRQAQIYGLPSSCFLPLQKHKAAAHQLKCSAGGRKNPMQFLPPGFRSPNCPRLPVKSLKEITHFLCASPLQTRKRQPACLTGTSDFAVLAVWIMPHLDAESNILWHWAAGVLLLTCVQ